MTRSRGRVLVAKPGLDGHDRGVQVVARALRDAGLEVIYTGIRQTPQTIVATAISEDVDLIGLSMLAGSHVEYSQEVFDELRRCQATDIPVIVGGIIPDDDRPELERIGVKAVFGPGTATKQIVLCVDQILSERALQ